MRRCQTVDLCSAVQCMCLVCYTVLSRVTSSHLYFYFLHFLINFSDLCFAWQGLKDANKQDSAVPAIDTIVELLERSSNDNQVSDVHSLSLPISPSLSLFPSSNFFISPSLDSICFHTLRLSLILPVVPFPFPGTPSISDPSLPNDPIPDPSPHNEQKSEEVLKAAVGLLGDLGQIFGSRMSQVYHMPFVKSVINPSCLSCLQCLLMIMSTVMRLTVTVFIVLTPLKVFCCC
jgi:hypothetical protein